MSSTEIMIHLQYEINTNVKMNTNNIGKSLKFLGYERVKHPSEKIYGYYVIFKK